MLYALLYALLLWWAGTGVILWLNRLPRHTHPAQFTAATVLLGVALAGVAATADDTRASGAYLAFTAAIVVWGWQELGFLLGYLTGPRKTPCPPDARGWRRVGLAVQAILWHELALLVLAALVLLLSWEQPNQVAAWTFGLLWVMRLSAKLNVFLGVRNLNESFLPEHLRYLASYFRRRPSNGFFAPSMLLATVGAVLLWKGAWIASPGLAAFDTSALSLTAALLTLAVLEHAFLVLPLTSDRLWQMWGLSSKP